MTDSPNSYATSSLPYEINTNDELWKIPLSSAILLKPASLPQSAWTEHIPFAFWLIDSQKPNFLVELGTHFGLSYFAFCQAVQKSGLQTKCYAVDTWEGDEHTGSYTESVFQFVEKTNEQYRSFSTLYRSTFDQAISFFEDKSIDLLHIDGRHTYEAVRHDFYTWLPKMSERGIVLFHDTNVTEGNFGVFRLWEELSKEYPSFEFKHAFGLGVLGVGVNLPEKLKTFFETASKPGMDISIREVYERIGNLIRTEQELANAYSRMLEEQQAKEKLTAELDTLISELAEEKNKSGLIFEKSMLLSDSIERSEILIKDQAQQIINKQKEISKLQLDLNELADSLEVAHETIRNNNDSHDSQYRSLSKQLNLARQASADFQRQSENNKRTSDFIIQNLETELTRRMDELHASQKVLNDLTSSMTWKITTPIRMAASKFPKSSIFIKKAGRVLWWTTTLRIKGKLKERDYSRKLEENILKIKRSGLFDIKWYFEQYPDVKKAGVDPVRHYLEFGAKEGRNPNPLFDTNWYLRNNKDVADSGTNAFIHFIEFGALESRSPHPDYDRISYVKHNNEAPAHGINPMSQLLWFQARNNNSGDNEFEARDPSGYNNSWQTFSSSPDNTSGKNGNYNATQAPFQLYKVIYVSGFPNSPSHNFRVNDHIVSLNQSGISAAWIDASDVLENSIMLTFAEIVVLFRVATDPVLEEVIASCKKAGVLIAYDTDDYVFDPEVANAKNVDGLRFLNKEETVGYHKGVSRYRDAMKLAEVGIFSTELLADAAKELGLNTYVIKNGLSEKFIESSSRALKLRSKHRHHIYIGYASGTLTHQKDFSVVAPAIAKILSQFPHVRLKIIGLLKIEEFPELKGLEEQIEVHNLVPQHQLPYQIAEFDINIAPLEIGNPFCEAKSELKYFEAALLHIPTVASATAPYKRAITNSENGFLAVTEEDWYEALQILIKNSALREEIGQRAYAHSMANYGVVSKKNEVTRVFNTLFRKRRQRLLNKSKQLNQTVTIMTCPFEKGGGGHAIIIDMAKWLSKWGHSIIINFTEPTADYPTTESIEKEFKFDTTKMRALFNNEVPADTNIIFATFWSTIYLVEKSTRAIGRKYYMLLDFEPYFYPMGTEHILSLNTYFKKEFQKISWGPWIKNLLLKRYDINDTRIFPLYFNKSIYNDSSDSKRNSKKIIFFGRPNMPRRCYDLGLQVLQRYRELYGNQIEIVLFGSQAINSLNIPFKHTNLGVLTPLSLASLYRTAALGLVFSPTNPSKVPFEMMACGLPVMDLDTEGNEANYGSRENVFLVQPDPDFMAHKINEILNNPSKRNEVADNGRHFVSTFSDEHESAEKIFEILQHDSGTNL